ncbi:MAG: SEC-C metal-binding domain-containing protein, partial [Coriobacteriales bacterium]|nr:SEC-C metal-binding domain-containing protein [Coriobacteriales bacterium]
KEGVYVREENQTLATITLQNYFRLYDKLAGMTGTALTEDAEFREIYNLPVQAIPPNRPVIRKDYDDLVFKTIDYKFNAVADEVIERHRSGQPCLVGTVSIESSERLARILEKHGVRRSEYEVLNAKHHAREAAIVAQAGREGAITIATNMAGRGTDILLGGNPNFLALDYLRDEGFALEGVSAEQLSAAISTVEQGGEFPGLGEVEEGVLPVTEEQAMDAMRRARARCAAERKRVIAAGGLCVIGTERHESRRIDNQLRGRSGRQGDPGETQFYLSLDDDLMRLFGGDRMDRIAAMMTKAEMPPDMPIQAKMVTKAVESAQRKVEEINFSMRKNVLDYDDVMNKQRQVIYEERNKILDGKDLTEHVNEVTYDTVQRKVAEFCPEGVNRGEWDYTGLRRWVYELTGRDDLPEITPTMDQGDIIDVVDEFVDTCYAEKSERLSPAIMHQLTTQVMLRVIDTRWMAYLQEMDYLKTGIGLRGFGQRDPLVEYKSEAYAAFSELVNTMYEDFLRTILHLELAAAPAPVPESDSLRGARFSGPADVDGDRGRSAAPAPQRPSAAPSAAPSPNQPAKPMTYRKADDPDIFVGVGRNDPCPCGSGKKFKNCHGRPGAR